MNGFAEQGLDEGSFGESKAFSAVKAFDAFRKPTVPPSLPRQTKDSIAIAQVITRLRRTDQPKQSLHIRPRRHRGVSGH